MHQAKAMTGAIRRLCLALVSACPVARKLRVPVTLSLGLSVCVWLAAPAGAQDNQAPLYRFTTIAGSPGVAGSADGPGAEATFRYPRGLAVDEAGAIYVSDTSNQTIRTIRWDGTNWLVTTIAGSPGAIGGDDGLGSDARFYNPGPIVVKGTNTLYLADGGNSTLRLLVRTGSMCQVSTILGSASEIGSVDGTNDQARLGWPSGMAADQSGNLFIADLWNDTIRKATPIETNWVLTTIAGSPKLGGDADGTNNAARFASPAGIAVDTNGALYVSEAGNDSIRMLTPQDTNWIVTTIAGGFPGSADGTGTNAGFDSPYSIAIDPAGTLYVADFLSYTIRRVLHVGTDWIVTTIGGQPYRRGSADGNGTNATFNFPESIAVDKAGNLYIANSSSHVIRMGVPIQLPTLSISLAGANVLLSWPLWASNFVLEAAVPTTTGWAPITNTIVVSADKFTLTEPATATARFHRLRLH